MTKDKQTMDEILAVMVHCTGVCDGKDCPYYKHSNPAWCLAMNIKEMQETTDQLREGKGE